MGPDLFRLVKSCVEIFHLLLDKFSGIVDGLVVDRGAETSNEEFDNGLRSKAADVLVERCFEFGLKLLDDVTFLLLGQIDVHDSVSFLCEVRTLTYF